MTSFKLDYLCKDCIQIRSHSEIWRLGLKSIFFWEMFDNSIYNIILSCGLLSNRCGPDFIVSWLHFVMLGISDGGRDDTCWIW